MNDRGRPTAILGPIPGRVRVDEGVAEGWVTPPSKRGLAPVRRHQSTRRTADVLTEDRDELAASIAEQTGVRSLDALHLGAAQRVGRQAITFLTFDLRQAQAARNLGLTVVGA